MLGVPISHRLSPRSSLAIAITAAVAIAASHRRLGDVKVYRAGGRAILGGNVYAVHVGAYGFTYPPFAAELFAAIAWLPVSAMFVALTAASAAALYVVLRRSLPDIDTGWRAAACVMSLALTRPVVATVVWGQIDLVLAALVLHDLLVRRSGVLVGLAAAVKLTPAIFIAYLLICGRKREAWTATLTFAGAAVFGALTAPTASWRYWTHDAFAGSGIGGFNHVGNQSVRGLAERLLGPSLGSSIWLLLAVPLLVVGLVLARRAARAKDEILGAGIAGVTACLVSPVSWTHHWVWCIPCLATLPAFSRLTLAALFASPFELGHTIGVGYPLVALTALTAGWWHSTRAVRLTQRTTSQWPVHEYIDGDTRSRIRRETVHAS
jgi:alpha-1,2-mannosyltransferase